MNSIESSGGRLSPLNITDPLLRAELMREIRRAQTDRGFRDGNWAYYEIQPSDALSPELIAWKVYGVSQLKWLVMMAAGLDDTRDPLQSGMIIWLPTTVWLRERVKEFCNLEEQ